MTPATIIREAQADGVRLLLSPSGTIKANGDGLAVHRWLAVIREHRAGIIDALKVGADDRVRCVECSNNRQGRCTRHHQAGLSSAVIGPELAMLPQHCTACQHIATSGEKQ
jgi:hypothetical protein